MAWIVASTPFWLLGAALVIGGICAPFRRYPGERDSDLIRQFVVGLLSGGVLLLIAAKIAS